MSFNLRAELRGLKLREESYDSSISARTDILENNLTLQTLFQDINRSQVELDSINELIQATESASYSGQHLNSFETIALKLAISKVLNSKQHLGSESNISSKTYVNLATESLKEKATTLKNKIVEFIKKIIDKILSLFTKRSKSEQLDRNKFKNLIESIKNSNIKQGIVFRPEREQWIFMSKQNDVTLESINLVNQVLPEFRKLTPKDLTEVINTYIVKKDVEETAKTIKDVTSEQLKTIDNLAVRFKGRDVEPGKLFDVRINGSIYAGVVDFKGFLIPTEGILVTTLDEHETFETLSKEDLIKVLEDFSKIYFVDIRADIKALKLASDKLRQLNDLDPIIGEVLLKLYRYVSNVDSRFRYTFEEYEMYVKETLDQFDNRSTV